MRGGEGVEETVFDVGFEAGRCDERARGQVSVCEKKHDVRLHFVFVLHGRGKGRKRVHSNGECIEVVKRSAKLSR